MEKLWEELTENEKNAKVNEVLRGYKEAMNAPISEEGIRKWKEILAEHGNFTSE